MTPEQVEQLIRQAREAWMNGDGESFATLFLPDGELIVPGMRWRGQDAIHETVTEFASSHSAVKIEIRRILVAGNSAVVEWYWEDTENKTGQRSRAEDAIVVDFKDGRIERWREYIDAESPEAQR